MKRSFVATEAALPGSGASSCAPMDELVATTADADRLRDELAAIEEEQATLEAELAAFNADYLREVVTVLAELHEHRGADRGAGGQALGDRRGQGRRQQRARPRAGDDSGGQGDPAGARSRSPPAT